MPQQRLGRVHLWLLTLLGTTFLALGALFLLAPETAEQAYGLRVTTDGYGLHRALAAREAFLGPLVLALAWLHRRTELVVVLLITAVVPLADLANVLHAGSGPGFALLHLGGFAGVLALALSLRRRTAPRADA